MRITQSHASFRTRGGPAGPAGWNRAIRERGGRREDQCRRAFGPRTGRASAGAWGGRLGPVGEPARAWLLRAGRATLQRFSLEGGRDEPVQGGLQLSSNNTCFVRRWPVAGT